MSRIIVVGSDSVTLDGMKIREPVPNGGPRMVGASSDMGRMAGTRRRSSRSFAVRAALGVVAFAFAAGLIFSLGFLGFAVSVASSRPPEGAQADGIVALTGGRDRVFEAVELLEGGHGRRLLISGVHPQTRAADIRRLTDSDRAVFACCVDLGRTAETTAGNAREAAEWAKANGFSSLIVVTSAYHMPRSLVELDRALPGVRKVPYPVAHPDLALDRWYLRASTAKLLFSEYVKYTVARFAPTSPRLHPTVLAGGAADKAH